MKGQNNFIDKLDTLFTTSSETTGRHQADITGLIGQYAHGNEPSHHMAYLYAYASTPWKTQKLVRQIMKEMYHDMPDGLSGNEDCGQMSAWYVFSAMGFYPVCPGSNDYILGSPLFDKIDLNLPNGNSFTIKAINNSDENIYIQSAKLNGKDYNKSYISHFDIVKGGKLELIMGKKPNKSWGNEKEAIPNSSIVTGNLVTLPYITNSSQTFYGEKTLALKQIDDLDIYYRLNNTTYKIYNKPIRITETSNIDFFAKDSKGNKSYIVHGLFIKMIEGRTISLKYPYNSQYTGGGDQALIDMIKGSTNFADLTWQGYQSDFEATIDLGKNQEINKISTGFIQSASSWIWIPKYVEFYSSNDGKSFKKIGTIKNDIEETEMETVIKDFTLNLNPEKTRYIKVFAKNIGVCPEWHFGAGGKSWIFIDEIDIK
jgi:hypothetical protein